MRRQFLLAIPVFLISCAAWCQEGGGTNDGIIGLPDRFLSSVNRRAASLEARLTSQRTKYLQRLSKYEQKLSKKLYKTDSLAAKALAADAQGYEAQLHNEAGDIKTGAGGGAARKVEAIASGTMPILSGRRWRFYKRTAAGFRLPKIYNR